MVVMLVRRVVPVHEQDLLCRVFGRCLVGDRLDRKIGDLRGPAFGRGLFTYLRYNADLISNGLARLGVNVEPERVQKLDAVESIGELQEVARRLQNRSTKLTMLAFWRKHLESERKAARHCENTNARNALP